MTSPHYQKIESDLNRILTERCSKLMADSSLIHKFSNLFDRRREEGFYASTNRGEGGEQPAWSPNEAYMQSLEWIWEPADAYLEKVGLRIDQTLRTGFRTSREYRDERTEHRRVFFGQLVGGTVEIPLTSFMLTVSHSHRGFHYPESPVIQISRRLCHVA